METRDNTHSDLNAAEWSQLWSCYMNVSMGERVLSTFLQQVEDEATRQLLIDIKDGLLESETQLKHFLGGDGREIPTAFTNMDINLEAPRLYTDHYYLLYGTQIGAFGMFAHTQAATMTIREDVRAFFSKRAKVYDHIHDQAVTLALKKGIYQKPPTIPVTNEVDFVQKNAFMKGFFGDKRPLTAMEITYLHINLQRNSFGRETLLGFSQVAQSDEVRDYIVKGMEIARSHVNTFRSILEAERVPVPEASETLVTDEHREAPYSDKLMVFLVSELISVSLSFYSMAMTTNVRRDLTSQYIKLSGEILKYASTGAKLMIKNGWMEEPPRMIDREELIHHKQKGSKGHE